MEDVTSTYRSRGPAIGSAVIAGIFIAWMARLVVTVEFALGQHGLLTRVGLVKLKDGGVSRHGGFRDLTPRPDRTTRPLSA